MVYDQRMTSKSLATTILAVALATPISAEETLLLLARHAEKASESGNPDLTTRGLQRAAALADIAAEWNVGGVYSTDFCRTAQTAQPTAARLHMPIVVQSTGSSVAGLEGCTPEISSPLFYLDPELSDTPDLLSWILEQHAGGAVLIVGHSNTVPQMLARLGVGAFQIADDQYDRLFMVTHDSTQGARVVETSYGEVSAGEEMPAAVDRLPIVDRAIAFHGGEIYSASLTRLNISSRSGSFDLEVTRRGSLFEYVVADSVDDVSRTTHADNDSTERSVGGEPLSLDEEATQRARDFVFARVYFPFLPFGLNDPDVLKVDQGIESWAGRELHRVKVTFTAGSSTDASDDYAYWFDPSSGRLEQYAYSFGNGTPRGGLRFRRLSNYRRVGGLLFFDAGNIGLDGEGDFTVDRIDPEAVEQLMHPVSEVVLSEITVEPLSD